MIRDHMIGWTGHLMFLDHAAEKEKPRKPAKSIITEHEQKARLALDKDPSDNHYEDVTVNLLDYLYGKRITAGTINIGKITNTYGSTVIGPITGRISSVNPIKELEGKVDMLTDALEEMRKAKYARQARTNNKAAWKYPSE